jgi:hypothetical protein
MAIGAFRGDRRGQKVMRAALGGALLGVTPFWIRHCSFLSNSVYAHIPRLGLTKPAGVANA